MISVRSLQQPLSGNSLGLFASLLLICLLSACVPKKKAVTNTPRPSSQGTQGPTAKSKVDTIRWKEEVLDYDIGTMTDQPQQLKSSYNIAVFIPFGSDNYLRNQLIEPKSSEYRFVNYYAGLRMALNDLEVQGAKFRVNILDSESGNFEKKLKSLSDQDVIIGPYNRTKLKETAEYCRKNEIVNISPWQASSKITSDNPYHVQLRPNQTAYYDALVADATKNYNNDQIVLLGRNDSKDKARMKYLKETAEALTMHVSGAGQVKEYFIELDSLDNEATTYDEIFLEDRTTAFVMPQWSSEDEAFIYACLRKLAIEKGENNVVVYGMPIFINSEKITFDYLKSLDVHIARAKWVDRNDSKVNKFRAAYFRQYNALPSDDALDGYDTMMFVGSNLMKDGKTFQHTLDQDQKNYLQTSYDIQKVFEQGDQRLDNFNNINYFENRSLDIIRVNGNVLSRED